LFLFGHTSYWAVDWEIITLAMADVYKENMGRNELEARRLHFYAA
jgi:hypothetical protein